MKKSDIIGLLEMFGVFYINYETYIYVRSEKEDDDAMWCIQFKNNIGFNQDTGEIVDYKLFSLIQSHNLVMSN
jgi:hypothetical protein